MSSIASAQASSTDQLIEHCIDELLVSLPNPGQLSQSERRGIIARYTAVLEGNFIYWMTGAYLSVRSEEARPIILDNLLEEVRDSHPAMLQRFAAAAHAVPTDVDALAVSQALTDVRMFVGRLSAVPVLVMMAFFEGFIQRFMTFLAELASLQGSTEQEYTEVHGVCDIAHTQGLLQALRAEALLHPAKTAQNLFEGVDLLRTLIQQIVKPGSDDNTSKQPPSESLTWGLA